MATARMPDAFYDLVAHHLPPEQPVGLHGGRPRIGHRVVVRVIWFVLASGTRWEDVPPELGCSGRTAHRRLRAWEEAGIWDRLHADLLRLLRKAGELETDTVIIDGQVVMEGRRMTTMDEASVLAEARERAAALFARTGVTVPSSWPMV